MGSDVFQTQRRGSWIAGKERAEKVLADDISVDSRSRMFGRAGVADDASTTFLRVFGNVPAGSGGEDRRMVNGLFDVKRRRRQEG